MDSPTLSVRLISVMAMASNRVIGRAGKLPWSLSADLRWFKKLTIGHPVIMGRATMESIGRPLPKRRNLVISRSLTTAPEGFELVASCDAARSAVAGEERAAVIGGAQIFQELLPHCDELFLSYIFHPYEGDVKLGSFEDRFDLAEILFRDDDFELRRYLSRERTNP